MYSYKKLYITFSVTSFIICLIGFAVAEHKDVPADYYKANGPLLFAFTYLAHLCALAVCLRMYTGDALDTPLMLLGPGMLTWLIVGVYLNIYARTNVPGSPQRGMLDIVSGVVFLLSIGNACIMMGTTKDSGFSPKRSARKVGVVPPSKARVLECCVCKDSAPNVLCMPCMHLAMCSACAPFAMDASSNRCPLCALHVDKVKCVYVYMACGYVQYQ